MRLHKVSFLSVLSVFRDESGLWWFIGCRGFKMSGDNGKSSLKFFMTEAALMFDDHESDEDKKKKK